MANIQEVRETKSIEIFSFPQHVRFSEQNCLHANKQEKCKYYGSQFCINFLT